jgi:tripartite-type tricarboxylate transporter receptor subunit TctC
LIPILRLIAIALFVVAAADAQEAQVSAKGPVRILVGFVAGGTTDVAARLLAESLRESLGRTIVVDNKPGASGRIAADALKHAAPDGTTIMLAPMVVTVLAPLVWSQLDYVPTHDFVPVAHVANYAIALAVNAKIPAGDVSEFVAWAKASPAQANYGTPAAGSLPHLFGVTVGRTTGLTWVHVPYRGLAPMANDLMGGQISASFDALSNLIELHRAGKIRIIATSGLQRSSLLPDVATFKEQGFAPITGTGWIAMYAPAGTPKRTIDELSMAIGKALHDVQLREKLIQLGFEPTGTTADELAAIMAADTARWAPVIKASGFTAD